MIVFNGSKPNDPEKLRGLLRGVNDTYCFYDDLSTRNKRRLRRGKSLRF